MMLAVRFIGVNHVIKHGITMIWLENVYMKNIKMSGGNVEDMAEKNLS